MPESSSPINHYYESEWRISDRILLGHKHKYAGNIFKINQILTSSDNVVYQIESISMKHKKTIMIKKEEGVKC